MSSKKTVVDKCYGILEQEVDKMGLPNSAVKRVYLRYLKQKIEKELTPSSYIQKLHEEGLKEIGKINAVKSSLNQNALHTLNKRVTPVSKNIHLSPIKEDKSLSQSPKKTPKNSPVKSPKKSPKKSPVKSPRPPKRSPLSF